MKVSFPVGRISNRTAGALTGCRQGPHMTATAPTTATAPAAATHRNVLLGGAGRDVETGAETAGVSSTSAITSPM